jgi:hypothetical protein
MRTTLSIDDDLVPQLKTYAEGRDISVGKAVSELVRRGLNAPIQTRIVNGFHVVELPPNSPTISTGHVRKIEEELI